MGSLSGREEEKKLMQGTEKVARKLTGFFFSFPDETTSSHDTGRLACLMSKKKIFTIVPSTLHLCSKMKFNQD